MEHADTVENGRESDREREQSQPEVRASPKMVEKEAKKTRGISHPEKRLEPQMDTIETISFCFLLG